MTPPNADGTPKSPGTHVSSPAFKSTCNASPEPPKQDTPPDPAPEGRLIERWFGLLTDKLIRSGVHTSVQALENDIKDWIATWNTNPRPFTWTKTADEILNSLAELGTGHPANKAELTNRTSGATH
jgi:hypothetical protein